MRVRNPGIPDWLAQGRGLGTALLQASAGPAKMGLDSEDFSLLPTDSKNHLIPQGGRLIRSCSRDLGFGYLMQSTDSLKKILILGKMEGGR